MNDRGQYGITWHPRHGARGILSACSFVGRELTDAEIRDAQAAGNQAAAPLVAERVKLMRSWAPQKPLTREQMTSIMQAALKLARETEKSLVDTIKKVPSHWEQHVRSGGGLQHLRQAIDEAPGFEAKVVNVATPTVVQDFRLWIDHLLSRSEDGVMAIGYVSSILPDWLLMRDILLNLHHAAISAAKAVASLPNTVKILGVVALLLGGALVASKLTSSKSRALV